MDLKKQSISLRNKYNDFTNKEVEKKKKKKIDNIRQSSQLILIFHLMIMMHVIKRIGLIGNEQSLKNPPPTAASNN
jgi:hypothetical protein